MKVLRIAISPVSTRKTSQYFRDGNRLRLSLVLCIVPASTYASVHELFDRLSPNSHKLYESHL